MEWSRLSLSREGRHRTVRRHERLVRSRHTDDDDPARAPAQRSATLSRARSEQHARSCAAFHIQKKKGGRRPRRYQLLDRNNTNDTSGVPNKYARRPVLRPGGELAEVGVQGGGRTRERVGRNSGCRDDGGALVGDRLEEERVRREHEEQRAADPRDGAFGDFRGEHAAPDDGEPRAHRVARDAAQRDADRVLRRGERDGRDLAAVAPLR
mmetsp:Transcript_16292/g.65831  ORF Transcript_16292/g.65831 Transcript_16292/m.65831 type:complete len:210 (+) Transcript_16292:126-755(+)